MSWYHFEAEASLDARPEVIWDILADYRNGHPLVLPKPYFQDFTVEEGGVGEGTVISFSLRIMGTTRHTRGRVTTPEPGRVLVETYEGKPTTVTTFTLTPEANDRTRLRITTDVEYSRGLTGVIEHLLVPSLRRAMVGVYQKELANIERVARERAAAHAS